MKLVGGRRLVLIILVLVLGAGLAWLFLREQHTYKIAAWFARPAEATIPKGLQSLRAEECGRCHKEIYQEWQQTVHAAAWTDDYFQTDWKWDQKKQNCLNCHIPMAAQQPMLVVGFSDEELWEPVLKPNKDFDPVLRDEGVTCVACHLKNGKLVGPHKVENAPHPVEYDPGMRQGSGVCHRCHVTPAAKGIFWDVPKICSTIDDIELAGIKPDCISCHMPAVSRPLAAGFPVRPGRHHHWRGGHFPAKVKGDLEVQIEAGVTKGSVRSYRITLTNVGTLHRFPTGTPDRHIVVNIRLLDGKGQELKKLEQKLIRRIIWRPVAVEIGDSRLPFRQPQVIDFEFDQEGDGKRTIEVTADYFFLEEWRRRQISLPATSHKSYRIYQKTIAVD